MLIRRERALSDISNRPYAQKTKLRALFLQILAGTTLATVAWGQTDTLPAPVLLGPMDGAELHNEPRDVWFEWSAVPNSETYSIEIDCESCCMPGKFCSEVAPDRTHRISGLQGTRYRFEWFGYNRGRWRVWASAGFIEGEKSSWRTLSFKPAGLSAPPAAPKVVAPLPNAILPASPAEITFEWTPVAGARTYTLEVDPQGTCAPLKYCSDVGVYRIVENIAETHYTGVFPSQMWTRWRVWAVAGERNSLKSQWVMFQRPSTPAGLIASSLPDTIPSGAMPRSGIPAPTPASPATVMTPEYSAAARAAGLEGTATVYFEIAPSGQTENVRILQGLGMGLDEKAVQLVRTWRFASTSPPVQAADISFRLNGSSGWRVRRASYNVLREAQNEPDGIKPVLISYVKPDAAACPIGEHSIIALSFDVNKKGLADKVVVGSSPAAPALRDSVRAWRFEPARMNGRERTAKATIDMECDSGVMAGSVATGNPDGTQPGIPATPPSILFKVEPEYSEGARQARYNGSVAIQVTVDQDGFPTNLRVARPIGLGLDEKALEALKQWRFRPAMRDGRPIPFQATVEISFRLL